MGALVRQRVTVTSSAETSRYPKGHSGILIGRILNRDVEADAEL